jgi:hypothetical protein
MHKYAIWLKMDHRGGCERMKRQILIDPLPITHSPKEHFFGYYDKQQWDPTGRYLLGCRTDFRGRSPGPEDILTIGLIDIEADYSFQPFSETRAWCWQQGCMLQWVPNTNLVIHNERIGDRFVAILIDFQDNSRQILPRPIYTISSDGKSALSLNFSRLADTRPGYGYNGLEDLYRGKLHPHNDGIYLMNLETGEHELIVSLDKLARLNWDPSMEGKKQWFNHLLFNPTSKRFIFLHRWPTEDGRSFHTRLCTANIDGSEIFVSSLRMGSHFIWYDHSHILIWGKSEQHGAAYHLVEDRTDKMAAIGKGLLGEDGHCTVSKDKRWLLTDQYPDQAGNRPLILFDLKKEILIDLGNFHADPVTLPEFRCDLHPRWDRTGRFVCVDSVHEGSRQMYLVDLGKIICEME